MPTNAPFSMIREFHLADWFTLGNAVCGVSAIFSVMSYLDDGNIYWMYQACALAVIAPKWPGKVSYSNKPRWPSAMLSTRPARSGHVR